MCYKELGDIDNAFKYMNKSLEMKKLSGDLIGIAKCYGNLVGLYRIKDPLKSIEYGKKAIQYYKELDMNNEAGMGYVNLSISYNALSQVKEELECLKKAEEIFTQCEHSGNLITCFKYILAFALRENDSELSKEYEGKIENHKFK